MSYQIVLVVHILSVISWMAALFYLPRVMVYHTEYYEGNDRLNYVFELMEYKLQRYIMTPAMIATLLSGLTLVGFGYIDWSLTWPYVKLASVITMCGFHGWLITTRKKMSNGNFSYTGTQLRVMNEVPTILLTVIVISVIIQY